MPYRMDETMAKIQFQTSAQMPHLIYKACLKTGLLSNTAYLQNAVCQALARDLDMDLGELLGNLPPRRKHTCDLFDGDRKVVGRAGPANTVEEVK